MLRRKRKIWLLLSLAVLIGSFAGSAGVGGTEASAATDTFKFDFGPGRVADGYRQVLQSTAYSSGMGYGFGDPTKVACVNRGQPDPLLEDYCSPNGTSFVIDLPQGDYSVTVRSGDQTGANSTEIYVQFYTEPKAKISSSAGKFGKADFKVYVENNQLKIYVQGTNRIINALEITRLPERQPGAKPTVYIASDSTAASYSENVYPLTGWGQRINNYFTSAALFNNRAIGGRSSKSYVFEGHLDNILTEIRPGDYLFFQWGHNDNQSTDNLCSTNKTYCNRNTKPYTSYKEYLKKYVDGARFHKANPVIITPMGKRNYDAEGNFVNDFADYSDAARQVAAENQVPLIDLNEKSIAFYNRIGVEATKEVFLYTDPFEYPAYQTGKEDKVHFQDYGAKQLAKIIAASVKELQLPLARYLNFPDPPLRNLAIGAIPSASTSLEKDGWYLWNISDEDEQSNRNAMGWSSENPVLQAISHTEWIQLDMGTMKPVAQVEMVPRNDAGNEGTYFPIDFTIELSEDGSEWTTVVLKKDYPLPQGTQTFSFPPRQARYVKVVGTKLRPNPNENNFYRMQLNEMGIYSNPPSTAALLSPAQPNGSDGWYMSPVTVALEAAADMTEVTRTVYSLNGGATWETYTGPITFDRSGKYALDYRSTDAMGNREAIQTLSLKMDLSAPVTITSIAPSQPDGRNGWYTQPVSISLSAADDGSGAVATEYSMGDGTVWQAYAEPITLSSNATHVLSYRSKDAAGNTEKAQTVTVRLDAAAPAIAVSAPVAGSYRTTEDLTPQFTAHDADSGIDPSLTTATLDGSPVQPGAIIPLYTLPLGTHTYKVSAVDMAGNAGAVEVQFRTVTDMAALKELVLRFTEKGWINAGISEGLKQKLDKGDLQGFISQVEQLRGQLVTVEAADYLLRDARSLY